MRNVNKVTLIGNVTNDPESKKGPSGVSICTFDVATNRYWKDQNGDKKTSVEFHHLVCFGKFADFCGEAVQKGKPLYVEGHLKTSSWENADKVTMRRTEIIVDELVLLSSKKATVEEDKEETAAEAGIEELVAA
jgi:single-strand DNA-binding protein